MPPKTPKSSQTPNLKQGNLFGFIKRSGGSSKGASSPSVPLSATKSAKKEDGSYDGGIKPSKDFYSNYLHKRNLYSKTIRCNR